MLKRLFFTLIFAGVSAASALEITSVQGVKFPNSLEEGVTPIVSNALAPKNISDLKGFNELLPFLTPSPDQEDANSCMLMSLTGAYEWWLHKLSNTTRFVQNGPLDISERWWMNMSEDSSKLRKIKYWYTDAIYLFNMSGGALNYSYPFQKGWYVETENDIMRSSPSNPRAKYGVRYNWIDDTEKVKGPFINLTSFERKVLHRDKKDNPWAIASAPASIVQKTIDAFQKYKAPIQVIYNHEGYWHSVFIIGYDEEMSSHNCPFTTESLNTFQKEADLAKKENDEERERRFLRYKRELTNALEKGGGCHPKGMFYVRDSQYPDPSEEDYIYDPENPQANKPYSKRVVLREFDWLRTMANHVSVIYVTNPK